MNTANLIVFTFAAYVFPIIFWIYAFKQAFSIKKFFIYFLAVVFGCFIVSIPFLMPDVWAIITIGWNLFSVYCIGAIVYGITVNIKNYFSDDSTNRKSHRNLAIVFIVLLLIPIAYTVTNAYNRNKTYKLHKEIRQYGQEASSHSLKDNEQKCLTIEDQPLRSSCIYNSLKVEFNRTKSIPECISLFDSYIKYFDSLGQRDIRDLQLDCFKNNGIASLEFEQKKITCQNMGEFRYRCYTLAGLHRDLQNAHLCKELFSERETFTTYCESYHQAKKKPQLQNTLSICKSKGYSPEDYKTSDIANVIACISGIAAATQNAAVCEKLFYSSSQIPCHASVKTGEFNYYR